MSGLLQFYRKAHMILIRIKATGQVVEMMEYAAIPRLNSGEAEIVEERTEQLENTKRAGLFEHAARFLRLT